jgi:DNA modification methylase
MILTGDCRETLRTLPDQSVHCCVTSPPYFGLRDYGTGKWEGGDPDCDHKLTTGSQGASGQRADRTFTQEAVQRDSCRKCGATRVDQQVGLEATPDEFVQALVEVFREVRRVLRDDGTCWLNLGDNYASRSTYNAPQTIAVENDWKDAGRRPNAGLPLGCKEKDLIGIPWLVAFALRADGWYLRQEIIWAKKNTMPESVRDRCTKSHEHIFLLTKRRKYFFDSEAIKEEAVTPAGTKGAKGSAKRSGTDKVNSRPPEYAIYNGFRNKRDVWFVGTKPFKEAHFATFPPDLIEPCILAGTSERGVCAECGAPWVREIEKRRDFRGGSGAAGTQPGGKHEGIGQAATGNYDVRLGPVVTTTTTGWSPSCDCNAAVVPATVLDPFFGAGTTGLVALQHGRNYVGCELNPEYVEIAERRLTNVVRPIDPIADALRWLALSLAA